MCQFCYISYFLFIGFCVIFEVVILSGKGKLILKFMHDRKRVGKSIFIIIVYNWFFFKTNISLCVVCSIVVNYRSIVI